MDIEAVKHYWLKNAELKLDTAESLFQSKKYADCLFFYHLVTECLLKALVAQVTNGPAPYTHDLERLAELATLEINDEHRRWLREITGYNMKARYPEVLFAFHQKATKEYTEDAVKAIHEIIVWIKNSLNN